MRIGDSKMHTKFDLEYEQINQNIRLLADVRFKLLALVPALGGAGALILSNIGLQAGTAGTAAADSFGAAAVAATPALTPVLMIVLLVSVFGFLATLGIALYDQRNSELYNALIHRARHLERDFNVPSTPGGIKKLAAGGQFRERPAASRSLLAKAKHDVALSLIYGPLLGVWCFPIVYAAARLLHVDHLWSQLAAAVSVLCATIGFTRRLVALDDKDTDLYHQAAERDGLKD
jgi:hypothetical protein